MEVTLFQQQLVLALVWVLLGHCSGDLGFRLCCEMELAFGNHWQMKVCCHYQHLDPAVHFVRYFALVAANHPAAFQDLKAELGQCCRSNFGFVDVNRQELAWEAFVVREAMIMGQVQEVLRSPYLDRSNSLHQE